ncbi:MAG TPA: hypothetical protein VKT82_22405 [Ktedonobacterales bacterium]|nr:hypothetical protein [Ktedonobacterales bacterium]
MPELDVSRLPDLPQCDTIRAVASYLWQDARVVALWVGGSLASGAGDLLSDADFRVAVAPEDFAAWRSPPLERIFAPLAVVGQTVRFGDAAAFYQLVLSNGEIFDFLVQSTARRPPREPLLVLGCHSADFERVLAEQNSVPPLEMQPVSAEAVRELVVNFWSNSHKHKKVLYRGLDLMATIGIQHEHNILIRLWYIEASGQDCGDVQRQTIHSLTSVIRAIEQALGPQAMELIGAPMRYRQELMQAIERNRQAVSRLGPGLAERYGFDYPAALEAVTLEGWQAFLEML